MDEDTVFKTAAAVFLFVVACAAGLVPLVARSGEKVHKHGPLSSALNCAAAGILLESGLCHLLPENAQLLQDAWGARLPYAHLVCGLGFLLILVADYSAAFCADTAASSSIPRSYAVPTPDGGESQPLHYQHLGGGSYAAGHRASLQPVYFTAAKARSSSAVSPRCLRCGAAGRGGGGGSGSGSGGGGGSGDDLLEILSPAFRGHTRDGGGAFWQEGGRGGGPGFAKLALLAGLCLHSVMEGLGIGASRTQLWGAVAAVLAHKALIASALGAALTESGSIPRATHVATVSLFRVTALIASALGAALTESGSTPRATHVATVSLFALMTPLGIAIGAVLSRSGGGGGGGAHPAAACAAAAAAGTYLYVGLMELLPGELSAPRHGALKLMAVVGGFCGAAAVGAVAG
ncbi:hypothetical protein JKP88DRAFT_274556 [Tribonema minus]|uniref:Uncharacterized protein n=1 Tax=Tribonema minus TaxID=303371 RepID=A0A835YR68_9STRA|nr:hypothetical protein JKP88DRAFT_274556 [Tribonema minus]